MRQLVPGARPADPDPEVVVSPVDGRVQAIDRIEEGCVLQAKGRSYPLEQLLGGAGESHDLEGGTAWTVYLSPADYHRIHAPDDVRIEDLRWIAGARYSVAPKVLARRTVLPVNERVVLRLSSARGPLFLVLVGATNVGRIRVVGVEPGRPAPSPGRDFARGEELARFEMGSTIVLVSPLGGASALPELLPGQTVRLGQALGRVAGVPQTA